MKFTFNITGEIQKTQSVCTPLQPVLVLAVLPGSYLVGIFDNLMEGGEDAESTTMVVEVVKGEGEGEGGGGGQTDRESVQVQEYGVQIHTHTHTQRGGAKWEMHRCSPTERWTFFWFVSHNLLLFYTVKKCIAYTRQKKGLCVIARLYFSRRPLLADVCYCSYGR